MKNYNNKPVVAITNLGKMPPQAIDMEELVLGILLADSNAMNEVVSTLHPEMFYREGNKKIFASCLRVFKKAASCDLWMVTEDLRSNNDLESAGGPVYITTLTTKVVSSANLNNYSLLVKQKYIQREFIRISTELQNRSFDDSYDIADLFEYAETELLRISGTTQKKEPISLGRFIDRVIDNVQKIINHEIKFTGKPSGFTHIDRKTGGFKDGELVIIAARPSVGKSALALQIAINAAEVGTPAAIFSLEMSGESLAQRSISSVSGKTNVELNEGKCDIDYLIAQTEAISRLPIYIDDSAGISVMELRAKTRKLMIQHGVKLVIADYLQLMSGDGQSREQEVSSISRGLKAIAKDLCIPVIALSQLSRKCEERADKRPMLSDLRESGAIEQDADMVWFPYRPAICNIQKVFIDNIEHDSSGIMEIIIAKNRNGITGSFFLKHNVSLTKIEDIEELTF